MCTVLADGHADRPTHRSKLDGGLHGDIGELVRVIVRTRSGKSVGSRLRNGAGALKAHAFINAITVSIQADELAGLESDEDVESVSLDLPVTSDGAAGSPSAAQSTQDVLRAT